MPRFIVCERKDHRNTHAPVWWEVVERFREHPLAVVRERHVASLGCRHVAHDVADLLNAQRREGVVEGMTRFSWWKDGTQMVGACGTTLKQAIADLDREGAR